MHMDYRYLSNVCISRIECTNDYNSVLSNFQCVHKDSPPIGETDCPLLSCAFARKQNYGHVLGATCDDGRIMILNTEFTRNDNYPYTSTYL